MYQKISIHHSWVKSKLIFLKLTPNIHFNVNTRLESSCGTLYKNNLRNQIVNLLQLLYVICFLISSYVNNFFNWKPLCMSKYNKGKKVFSKYMDKGLPCLYVHGYCKIVNVSKNINLHYSQVVWLECTPCMIIFSHNKLMATFKNWHLVYSSYHFLIIIDCYSSCVFFIH